MRLREVLFEYSRRRTLATMRDRLLRAVREDRLFHERIRDLPEDEQVAKTLDALEAMDPTSGRKYVDWIVREYTRVTRGRDRQQFWIEDAPRVTEALRIFDRNAPRLRQLGRPTDIFRYTFRELEQLTDELTGRVEQVDPKAIRKPIPDELKDDVDILYAGPDGTLYHVKSWEAARYLGSGTKWCIAASKQSDGPAMFRHYASEGPIYVWIDREGKWAFVPDANEFRNARDEMIPPDKLRKFRRHSALWRHVFEPYERRLLRRAKAEPERLVGYARNAIGRRWPEAEPIVMQDPWVASRYARYVIRGRWREAEPVIMQDPWAAYGYARDVIRGRWPEAEPVIMRDPGIASLYLHEVAKGRLPEVEPIIMQDPETALRYAKDVIRGRWPEAEPIIMRDPEVAYWYAYSVVKGRWPEAEPVIMRDPWAAYRYAKDVIRGRWPEAEPVIVRNPDTASLYLRELAKGRLPEVEPIIMQDPETALRYAKDVIRGRWPEAEPIIMRDPKTAYEYARDVIKGRWPEAEPVIMRDPETAYWYADSIIGGRWPEAEPVIMRHPRIAYFYAKDVIRGRWPEAEETMRENDNVWQNYRSYVLKERETPWF